MTWPARRVIKIAGLLTIGAVAGLVLHRCYRQSRGIEVCLRNVDSQTLRGGEVGVEGSVSMRSYPIGDLAPAAEACVWVKADSEATIDVRFTLPSGAAKVIPLSGYIERGYTGSISAQVTGEGVQSIQEDVDPY